MNNGLHNNIFEHGDCVNESILLDYAHDRLSGTEKNKVEKHLLECELCSDALEGLMLVKDPGIIPDLKKNVVEKFAYKEGSGGKGRIILLNFRSGLAIAASIAILLVSVFLFKNNLEKETTVADNTTNTKITEEDALKITEPLSGSGKEVEKTKTEEPAKATDQEIPAKKNLGANEQIVRDKAEKIMPVVSENSSLGETTEEIADRGTDNAILRLDETTAKPAPEEQKEVAIKSQEKEYSDMDYRTATTTSQSKDDKEPLRKNSKKESRDEEKAKSRASATEPASQPGAPKSSVSIESVSDEENNKEDGKASGASFGQTMPSDNEVFTIAEQMPEFPGGQESLTKYVKENTKYPVLAKENNIQGTVYVTFIIEKDGSISNVKIAKGISGCIDCDNEAARVVKSMPKWTPGKINGNPVRVNHNLPVKFVL